MSEREKNTRCFVVDTNLFVAAVKPFSKSSTRSQQSVKVSKSLTLVLKLITSDEFELKGNSILVEEYNRFGEELNSPTSRLIVNQLIEKTRLVQVSDASLEFCKEESADIVHAATCVQTGSILITNDKHFRKIKESGKIQVWSITDAVRKLL